MARLGDVCEVLNGYAFKSEKYVNAGIRVIRITNVQKGYIEDQNPVFYPINSENIDKYKLLEGDLLMSLTGNVGRVACLSAEFLPAALNQRVACLRVKDFNILDKSYLFNLLNTNYFEEKCIESSNGVAQKNMSTDWLKDFEIPIPSLQKQKEIAEILDKVSGLIEKRKQQLLKLDELVKSRFIEIFGDPEINPKHWDNYALRQIIIVANNGMARRGNDLNGNIVMRLVELQDGYIDYSAPNRIILTDLEKKRYRLREKDFLFARVNGNPKYVGRCAVFHDIGEPVYHNDHIIRVHFNDDLINGQFASALLNSEYGKRQLQGQIKTSAGQYTISQEGIGAIITILPPIELQNQFAEFVEQVEKQKANIKQSLEKLEILKKSLMQKYFG